MHPQEVCVLKEATPARRLLLTWFLGPWHSDSHVALASFKQGHQGIQAAEVLAERWGHG